MIQDVAGGIRDIIEDETLLGKEALEPGGKATTVTTTCAYRKPAG
jgi:hypothetical protein